jgi:hypothetical protein
VDAPVPFAVTRHLRELSEKDTDAVVTTLAEIIVAYLKATPYSVPTAGPTVPRVQPQPPDASLGPQSPSAAMPMEE